MTHSRPTIHRLLDEYGLAARRELGQNFVADPNTVRRIAALSGVGEGDTVVEIGPGLGSLTLALVETGAAVIAVEIDAGLAAVARSVVGDTAEIVEADARELDWAAVLDGHPKPVSVVANLPYNIGTSLVLDILADVPEVEQLVVLVQREVGERLAARAGTSAYGIPSVLAAFHASVEVVALVPPSVFVPRPKVDSAVVRLVRHPEPPVDADRDALARVVRAGFGQRRKMLRRSLSDLLDEAAIAEAGIDPTARPEQLDLSEWAALARALQSDG